MTHDQGERWDNRRQVFLLPLRVWDEPWNDSEWRGPVNPTEAKACDAVMVELGTILAMRQFSNHYDTDAIYRAMRGIRKA